MMLLSTTLSSHPPPPSEDYIFSFASSATKKISESVVETAQTLKKTVEEGKIDGIIDKACCSSGLIGRFSSVKKNTGLMCAIRGLLLVVVKCSTLVNMASL